MADSLYLPEDGLFVPTGHTRGPWDPRAQHGGAPAALLARCIEQVEAPQEMEIARITVELLRPVPVAVPVSVQTRVERPGRKVQVVEALMATRDGTEVTRARALRIRREPMELPVTGAMPVEQPPPPDEGVAQQGGTLANAGVGGVPPERARERADDGIGGDEAFAVTGVELRFVRGVFFEQGPSTVWIRLRVPVLPGEEPSGVQRTCAAADFGNGVSSVYEWGRTVFINPDLTVHLARMPQGEWICLEAVTHPGSHGRALAESRLFDVHGFVGRSLQSLLVEPLTDR